MHHKTLRGVTLDELMKASHKLTGNEHKRVRHVLTENLRVVQFAAALARGDIAELGKLLSASHQSLAQDYEVSCRELDAIVDRLAHNTRKDGACAGARMVGGGFGGAVVALLKTSAFNRYAKDLKGLAKGGSRLLQSSDAAELVEL